MACSTRETSIGESRGVVTAARIAAVAERERRPGTARASCATSSAY